MVKEGLLLGLCVLGLAVFAAARPVSRLALDVSAEDVSFSALELESLSSSLYDTEAIDILRDADQSTHGFVAMLEEAEDDSVNLEHLISAFIQLPPAALEGDFDDGGPEGIRALLEAKANAPAIPATLARDAAGLKKEELDGSLISQDAAVLDNKNKPGSSFSSGIAQTFSDTTTNLATLTEAVTETRFRLDQLQRYIKRRLKCRVDPDSCSEAVPKRETKAKEECTRKYKYLCRSTYELTPGASSASGTGGPAAEVLVQEEASAVRPLTTSSPSHSKGMALVASEKHDQTALEKLVEKQQRQLEEQARLLKKATAQLQELKSKKVHKEVPMPSEGSAADTGAVRVRDRHTAPSGHAQAVPDNTANNSNADAEATPAQSHEEDARAAVEEAATPEGDKQERAGGESQAVDAGAEKREDVPSEQAPVAPAPAPAPAPASAQDAQADAAGAKEGEEEGAKVDEAQAEADVAAAMKSEVAEVANIQLASPALAFSPPTAMSRAEKEKVMAEAKAKALHRNSVEARRQRTHAQAVEWAHRMSGLGQGTHSHVFVPSHVRDLTMLAQLGEGVGEGMGMGMPDDEFIHHLGEAAFRQERDGTQNLLETGEGVGLGVQDMAMPDDSVIRAFAEQAALEESAKLAVGSRTCAERVAGVCELFTDGTRCLRTDSSSALCGFVVGTNDKGDAIRDFKVTSLSALRL